jgi:antirestriction protein ArdC
MLWGDAMAKVSRAPTDKPLNSAARYARRRARLLVVYSDRIKRTETADNGDEIEREIPFMKGYTVSNCEQIEGLPEHFYFKPSPPLPAVERIEAAERFAAATGADIRHGGNRAFCAIEPDYVQLPPFESFTDAESYYSTKFHELTHWPRHPSRLNREFGRKRWGDEGYAAEELVAELGTASTSASHPSRARITRATPPTGSRC